MKQRIITALILAPLVIWGIFALSLPWFITAILAVTLLGFWEWTQFVDCNTRWMAMIPAVLVTAVSFWALSPLSSAADAVTHAHYWVFGAGLIWWICASILAITYPKSTPLWEKSRTLRHLFGFLTLLPFLWSVVALRANQIDLDPYHGAKLVMYVCFLVWAADSGAYFVGKGFGKHKMAPSVSPNKTIEGLAGGIVAALIVGWIFANLFDIQFSSPVHMIATTMLTVVISVLGDLVESMFKRVSGIKDSSNIIPGHGGILDRIDSLTAAFPVFTLLYFIF